MARPRMTSSRLADQSSGCYKNRTKAGGGEPRADTDVSDLCQSDSFRNLGVGISTLFGGRQNRRP
jgi:hypothetical protein